MPTEPVLGLVGTEDKEPEIALAELEKLQAKGENELITFLNEETGKSERALQNALKPILTSDDAGRLRAACQDNDDLVAAGAAIRRPDPDRHLRQAGRHPQGQRLRHRGDRPAFERHALHAASLTEPIVQYTLEPLVYVGPAEGKPKEEWKLHSAKELLNLKICDMACGSGAFLVQACRYLAERLLEAWEESEKRGQAGQQGTPV